MLNKFPFIKIAIVFIIGIIAGRFVFGGFYLLPLLVVTGGFSLYYTAKNKNTEIVPGLYFLFVLISGIFIQNLQINERKLLPKEFYKSYNLTVYGRITNIEPERENEVYIYLYADSTSADNGIVYRGINLITKIKAGKEENRKIFEQLKPGMKLKLTGTLSKGRSSRNPGDFNYEEYLANKNIAGIFTVTSDKKVVITNSEYSEFKNFIFDVRKYLDREISKLHNAPTAALLKGFIIADRTEISNEVNEAFIDTGVVHVLSVSGLHTAYIVILFLVLFSRFNLFIRTGLTLTALLFFLLITGMPVCVIRATILTSVVLLLNLTDRSTNILNSLGVAAVVILIWDPGQIADPGFQLSFISVAFMALTIPGITKWIDNFVYRYKLKLFIGEDRVKSVLLFFAVTITAQAGTLPFILIYFGKLSIISIIANIFIVPLTGIMLINAFATLIFNIFSSGIAGIYGAANNLFTFILFKILSVLRNPDFAYLQIRSFTVLDGILYYTALFGGYYLVKNIKNTVPKILCVILVLSSYYVFASIDDTETGKTGMYVYFLDVGQGDAAIIKMPDGKSILIDAGNSNYYYDNGKRVIMQVMKKLGIEQFDYGFISHSDLDHCGGYFSLIKEELIKEVYKGQVDSLNRVDVKLESEIKKNNIPVNYYSKKIINFGRAKIYIMNDTVLTKDISSNSNSGVIKIVYGSTSFLFTGDIEKSDEKRYCNKYEGFLDSDVLKISHHGSITGSSEEFVERVSPEYSVISCGKNNKYGHPSIEVLSLFNEKNYKIYRTDEEGSIIFYSDGREVSKLNLEK